jgi:hypothetical protein
LETEDWLGLECERGIVSLSRTDCEKRSPADLLKGHATLTATFERFELSLGKFPMKISAVASGVTGLL